MADPTSKQNRWWLLLLLLLLLWWWWSARRKKMAGLAAGAAAAAAAGNTASTLAHTEPDGEEFSISIDTRPGPSIGGQTMAGFAGGDTSDSALARLAPETEAMLNGYTFQSDDPNNRMAGGPLLITYRNALARGDTVMAEQARAQIATALDPAAARRAGLAAAAAAASAANQAASAAAHTMADVDLPGASNTAAPAVTYIPPPAPAPIYSAPPPTYTPPAPPPAPTVAPAPAPTIDAATAAARAQAIAQQLQQQMMALVRRL
jgi:hypothetical protein